MIKGVLLGLWAALVTAGSIAGGQFLQSPKSDATKVHQKQIKTKIVKTPTLTIPVLSSGSIRGYLLVRFAYRIEEKKKPDPNSSVEIDLLDQAFAMIYADAGKIANSLDTYDLVRVKKNLLVKINRNPQSEKIHELWIQQFNFVAHRDLGK